MENPDEFQEANGFDADAQNESGSVAEAVCPCIEKRKKLLRDAVLIFALLLISLVLILRSGVYSECKSLLSDKSVLPMLKGALFSPLALYALLMLTLTV